MIIESEFENLHKVLRTLYDEMMPLCDDMGNVAKAIAAIAALFYIATRVWQSLARAEALDVYPLLRPFVIGLCIMFFSLLLDCMNTVLSPIVVGTHEILNKQTFDMVEYKKQKEELEHQAYMRNPETAYVVDDAAFDKELEELSAWNPADLCTIVGMYACRATYSLKKMVRDWFRELLELIFQGVALVIDTVRTFFLIVLSILGPIAFALGVFDGLHSTIPQWFSRYISIYLWLPVSDIFSSVLARIQVLMLQKDIEQLSDPNFIPDGSDAVYIIFLLIGILGYFTIPTVASWIVHTTGVGSYGKTLNKYSILAGGQTAAAAGAAGGSVVGTLIK